MQRLVHTYTQEEKNFIESNYIGITTKELTKMFNERFELNITESRMRAYKKNHGLQSGYDSRFKKGQTSFNKGLKQSDFMTQESIEKTKATRFKKGQTPTNYRQVGSERVTKDGYVEIKIADPNKWQLRSRYVWLNEKGTIPKGCCILHINGIKTDDRIENLMMITRIELARLNQDGLFAEKSEFNEMAINIAKIKGKITEISRRKNEKSNIKYTG